MADALTGSAGERFPDRFAPALPDCTGRRVLLVEDSAVNAALAAELLGMAGADVDHAENGAAAVERFRQSAAGFYDLILTDLRMPVMDGCAAARAIRALPRPDAKTVPIWALTAEDPAEDAAKTRAAGMDGYISKPVAPWKLAQALRRL